MVNAAEMRMGLGDVSPRHPGVAPTVLSMLQSARRGLAEAADESAPGARYVTAHLAALRAAAAVVAARGEPRPRCGWGRWCCRVPGTLSWFPEPGSWRP